MQAGEAMEVRHDDLVAIVEESKTRLKRGTYSSCGTSLELYKFSNKRGRGWKHGRIFRANTTEDIIFDKTVSGDVNAADISNEKEVCFQVHEPDHLARIEDMMLRTATLKHIGVLKPYVAGFNTQISRVVAGFTPPSSSLSFWLSKQPVKNKYIPIEVQQLIRTAYLAIERIWREGSSSDDLADINSYHMIDNYVKINPLCTRRKSGGENKMLLRHAFGQMIKIHIFSIWRDEELLDLIELLESPNAREINDVLEQPVLLLPPRRELLYHQFDKAAGRLRSDQKSWLATNAHPGVNWKTRAEKEDHTLKQIIKFQVDQEAAAEQLAGPQPAGPQPEGFSPDFSGALHFASVTTAHYLKHYKKITEGNWREGIEGRVDLLLKKVLPRLLSRRYNAQYVVKGKLNYAGDSSAFPANRA